MYIIEKQNLFGNKEYLTATQKDFSTKLDWDACKEKAKFYFTEKQAMIDLKMLGLALNKVKILAS